VLSDDAITAAPVTLLDQGALSAPGFRPKH
jgi:hypothetical protein